MTDTRNWQETNERYEAWWNGTLSRGPILKAFVLKQTRRSQPAGQMRYQIQPEWQADAQKQAILWGMCPSPHYLGLGSEVTEDARQRYWLDLPGRLAAFKAALGGTSPRGDAFLHFFPDFGSAVVASFLGVEPRYGGRSMLNESESMGTLEEIEPFLRFDPSSFWWRTTLELVSSALTTLDGSIMVGFPNLGGALDTLASMRGTQNLLMDLIVAPETVKRLELRLAEVWVRYYKELCAVLQASGQKGTTSWVGVLGSGGVYPVQCDLAVMISPDMFQEFAVPSLRVQAQALDRCIFHYHGEGPKKTLDHLLNMDEIHAIQWSPGVHDPPEDDESWLPVYRRITEAGKGLLLLEVRPDRVRSLLANLPAERMAINVLCESEGEADELLSRYGTAL